MRVPLSKKTKYQIKNLQAIVQSIKEPYQNKQKKREKQAKKLK